MQFPDEFGLSFLVRPALVLKSTPVYRDAFDVPPLGLVIFRRDDAGRVAGFSINQDRVWDLRFTRVTDTRSGSQR